MPAKRKQRTRQLSGSSDQRSTSTTSDSFDWLITGHDADSARAKAQQQLAPIAGNAALMQALAEYFRCGGEIQPAARALGLHPNSVRHRLKRIGSLLGRDLSSPSDLAEISLSVRLLDIAADTAETFD